MKCENCGQEFDGTVCPNCGNVPDKKEGNISDSMIQSENPMKHTEPASEKAISDNSKKKVFVVVISVLIALTAMIVVFSIVFSSISTTDLFRIEKIELVQIGMREEEVKYIYGDPDAVAESDSLWTYYSDNYKKLLKKAADGTDISEEAAALVHDEIRITFSDNNRVYKVEMLIDYSENTKGAKKEIQSVTLSQNEIRRYSYIDDEIYAIVEYRDGSYRNAPVTVTEQPYTGEAGFTSFTWHDLWSDSFRTDELNVVSDSEYEIKLKGQLPGTSVSYTTYKVNNGYALEINGYGDIKKPEFGYPWNQITNSLINVKISAGITGIGDNAFSWCDGLTSIRIPNSVTSIGDSAFYGCESLTSIEIPDGVTNVGRGAFDQTPWFDNQPDGAVYAGKTLYRYKGIMPADTNFSVREGTESIAAGAFYGCGNLKSIVIPSGVTSIGAYAFEACKNLQSVVIPSSVMSIGDSAFYGCESLTSIEIPDGVTSIGSYAFSRCNSLTSIVIPSSVTRIESDAFYDCMILVIYAEPENKPGNWHNSWNGNIPIVWDCKNNDVADDGYIYTVQNGLRYGIKEEAATVLKQPRNILEANIPSEIAYGDKTYNVTSIVPYAFYRCVDLEKVIVRNNVTSIKSSAFQGCENLTEVFIGNSVNNIKWDTFSDCGNLEVLTVAEGNTNYRSVGNCVIETFTKTLIRGCKTSVIPNDGSVTSIGSSAFSYCSKLTSIAIPDSVTSIGSSAFYGCSSLLSIEVPNSVTSIGFSAFKETGIWNNAADNSVVYADKWAVGYKGTLDGKLTFEADTIGIGDFAFRDCSGIRSVEVTDSVKNIGEKAFENCALTSMTMSASIAGAYGADKSSLQTLTITGTGSIPGRAFVDDAYDSLTNIVIENGVTGIGYNAFNCGNLTSIIIPQSVTSMGSYVFVGCPALTIYAEAAAKPEGWHRDWISSLNPVVWDYKNNETAADGYVYYIDNGIRYGLKDGEAKVAGQTTGLTTANIRETVLYKGTVYRVTSIGGDAFSVDLFRSRILKSVFIPDSVTSIDSFAFYGCSGLTSIEIPNSVTSISTSAFAYCSSLETITVAGGNPKYYSVSNCIIDRETKTLVLGCKNSIIPADGSVTSIGDYAFSGCSDLQSIVIPNGVTSIGDGTFWGCGSLQSIEIPDSVTSIGNSAFSGCSSLTSFKLPHSIISIGNGVFLGCRNLQNIIIPDSVTSIGDQAFQGCQSLTSIEIPSCVTSIGDQAFYDCLSLQKISIPSGVTSISDCAFQGCQSLTSIEIPSSVTSIGRQAFQGCYSLQSIAIPDSVTSIGSFAFYGTGIWNNAADNSVVYVDKWAVDYKGDATLVEALTLKAGTVGIGSGAFWGCHSLTSIAIPNSVTNIGSSAFYGCSSLTNVTIPNGVTSIGYDAFRGCSSLQSIAIPDSVTSIGYSAFYGCSSLTNVTIPNGVTSIGYDAFKGTGIWNNTADNSVVYADKWAVDYKGTIREVTLKADTVGIGSYAFEYCSSLLSIAIPDSVTSIGDDAFYRCSSLQSIEYQGTKAEWKAITKGSEWNDNTGEYTVTCTDGTLSKTESAA